MALSTIHTALMHGTTSSGTTTYSQLCCIKDYPDLGGTPSALETTTLCDEMQTFVEGVKSNEQLEFTANYTESDYDAIVALAGGNEKFAIWFGAGTGGTPDGHDGKFKFEGQISVRISGKGVDEVREMVIMITPSTAITKE